MLPIKRKGYAKERIRADSAEPKSNEDLRRMGIGRITPSIKGKDSILNGITQIQEYKIFVHPKCKNTIAELGSYCWQKDKSENGINKPSDDNNHLMDAMRYAFYDVLFFHPQKEKVRIRIDKSNITAADKQETEFFHNGTSAETVLIILYTTQYSTACRKNQLNRRFMQKNNVFTMKLKISALFCGFYRNKGVY